MQRGYYICFSSRTSYVGVDKKVDNQVKVFNQQFCCEKVVVEREKYNIIKSILWRLPFASFGRHYKEAYDMIQTPDFIYIRFVPVDRRFLYFIKTLRESFPFCKILLEIPTYPYQRELISNLTMFPFFFKDKLYVTKLKRYVDQVVTYTDDSIIFGIPAICVKNGIMVNGVKKAELRKKNDDKIVLLAVAAFQKAHGYERCLKGLAEYKKRNERKVEILFVGDGAELNYYKRLTKELGIEADVVFYGRKTGDELDNIYNLADIALGIFGLYKIKVYKSSALKIREYLAKGLPVVSGCYEDAFEYGERDFFLQFPNDKSIIDIGRVVQFYENIYESGTSREYIRDNIRAYAQKHLDMSVVMQPIINYIKE